MNKLNKIRNFSIIAHIDHGKSTLADRMLELTNTNTRGEKNKERILDRLDLEQERGITIKLQACKMNWKGYELNLIDTPGHVDFSYEVSRSLAACESAILLVDASQGIQAQTLSNAKKALNLGLTLIPVLNKIDLDNINIQQRENEIHDLLGFEKKDIIKVSGRTGENVELLLDTIVEKCPPPKGNKDKPLQALIFDSFYDEHKGVVVAIRVFNGEIVNKDNEQKLYILQKQESFTPTQIGIFNPDTQPTKKLSCGEVGYIATGLKDIKYFAVGDTISNNLKTKPLPGYKAPKSNVFATFFPTDTDEYEPLQTALNKLALNDAALTFSHQRSTLLGSGFRCGFLGLLHMQIIQERLEREYDVDLIITAPTVEYKIKTVNDETISIQTPSELPDSSQIEEILEPWVRVKILTPDRYMGNLMNLCEHNRGEYVTTRYLNQSKEEKNIQLKEQYIVIEYDIPLASLISNFFDLLKNLSSGYASMEYDFIDYFPVNLVKVEILVNKNPIPALAFLETRERARPKAVKLLEVMKEEIPRQQFTVPLQAAIGSKIIAREDVKALRKDVTAKLYGGDYSRKKKLLEKQKKGKKRLKRIGEVNIPQEAFLAILKT
jgi:GTP-binding protein LepA